MSDGWAGFIVGFVLAGVIGLCFGISAYQAGSHAAIAKAEADKAGKKEAEWKGWAERSIISSRSMASSAESDLHVISARLKKLEEAVLPKADEPKAE